MKKKFILTIFLLFSITIALPGYAAKCVSPKPGPELSDQEMSELYDCLHVAFVEAFGKKGHKVGAAYGDWKAASIRPAAPGIHSGQYLMTYINDVGYDQYVKFATDGSKMPEGTVIAKENFKIKKNGKIDWGPLLIMSKVGAEAAETGGWEYSGVKPKGKKLKVDGKGYCHACHQAYPTQDYQGYPLPDVRVSGN